jgi:UDP-N-acetylglucosamine 4,6-dehydratase
MTRFWITLQQGVDFVLKNFERMQGGEIFVPKIPSVRILELAQAMAPSIDYHFVGIRAGEKLDEVMCTADDARLTLEFRDHYVIQPSIRFHGEDEPYQTNGLGETSEPVPERFEYNSGTNKHFLSISELIELNQAAGFTS